MQKSRRQHEAGKGPDVLSDDGAVVVTDPVLVGHEIKAEQKAEHKEKGGRPFVAAAQINPEPDDHENQGQHHVQGIFAQLDPGRGQGDLDQQLLFFPDDQVGNGSARLLLP